MNEQMGRLFAAALARELGISQQRLKNWEARGIPAPEHRTDGHADLLRLGRRRPFVGD